MSRRRVSKFYIPGACANTRSNNLNFKSLSPSNFNCDRVQGFDADTCNKVIDQGEPISAESVGKPMLVLWHASVCGRMQ